MRKNHKLPFSSLSERGRKSPRKSPSVYKNHKLLIARSSEHDEKSPNPVRAKSGFDGFKLFVTLPVIIYSLLLIFLPLVYVFFLSFQTSDNYGGYDFKLTLKNYLEAFDPSFLKIFFVSIVIGLLTTFICLLISYPFAIFLRDKPEKTRSLIIKLVMVPFLTNSLIRTYGWITLLRKNGVINSGLLSLGIINSPLNLMYNNLGVIIGMVYTLLPFMILPVVSAVSKVDENLLDAAEDLGASKLEKFFRIYLPLTLPGAFNGSLMVFIPAIGYFFIADILGGGKAMIIGNLVKNQFLIARNWPLGAALSILLLVMTFGLVKLYQKVGGDLDELGG
ncbi:ABC transporter permease [Candidatus Saccharibacteria bacterium]|nr:ABC transporter permease [Candidatus Saccharibacteria bacterium]